MIKKIIIENVITEEDDKKILYYLNRFLGENFQKYKDIKVSILTEDKKD